MDLRNRIRGERNQLALERNLHKAIRNQSAYEHNKPTKKGFPQHNGKPLMNY